MKALKGISIILSIFCIVLIIVVINVNSKYNNSQVALKNNQDELKRIEALADQAQVDLSNTKKKLQETTDKLDATQKDLDDKRAQNASDIREISRYKEMLLGLSINLERTQSRDSIIDNPYAHNPTWKELLDFLYNDNTEAHPYIEDVYDCTNYANDLHNNAEKAGIKCAVVRLEFSNCFLWTSHALNAFITTDYGLVFIESSDGEDCECRIKTGLEYRAYSITYYKSPFPRTNWGGWGYYYLPSDYLFTFEGPVEAIVKHITIYWD